MDQDLQKLQQLFKKREYYKVYYSVLEYQADHKLADFSNDTIDILYLKLRSLLKLNFISDALCETNKLLLHDLSSISQLKLVFILLDAFMNQGNFLQATQIINHGDFLLKCLPPTLNSEDEKFLGDYYNLIGSLFFYRGDLENAIMFFKKSLTIQESYQETSGISITINNLGQVYQTLGEFDLATKCYLECISLDQSLNDDSGIAISLNNLGFICLQQGNLEDAYNYFTESYQLIKKIAHLPSQKASQIDINYKYIDLIMINFENHQFLGELLGNLASTYYRMGDIIDSLEDYSKALYVYQKINNSVWISDLYVQLITLHLENGNYNESKHYFELLSKMNDSESKIIQTRIQYAKGLFSNSEKRFKGKYEAKTIFYSLINSEVVDWNITIKTMTLLAELLFEEFRFFEDTTIIDEAKKIIDKMHTLAKDKKSFSLLTETYLLKMKFSVIEGNLE